jgi:hypothetical protein
MPVTWSRGRYDSYVLHPDGKMIDTIHPPGFAWMVTQDTKSLVSDSMTRNQLYQGRWFIGALLPRPFQLIGTGEKFSCQLILVMGANATAKSLHLTDGYLSITTE